MEPNAVIEEVRGWLNSMVIGLKLCPFAEAPFKAGTIRYAVCTSNEPRDLLSELAVELRSLAQSDRTERETTLLIAPLCFPDFLDFNDFVGIADEMLANLGFSGIIQIVAFHPEFRFAETPAEAPENYTNRSPYPLLHLLREESVSEVAARQNELAEIPKRNTETLRRLGIAGILERLKASRNT